MLISDVNAFVLLSKRTKTRRFINQEASNSGMETITIPKEEYEELKKKAEIDKEFVESITKSFEDIKHGRITEWKPK